MSRASKVVNWACVTLGAVSVTFTALAGNISGLLSFGAGFCVAWAIKELTA